MEPEQPILNIVGQKVCLGPVQRRLLPLYQHWLNDFEVARTLMIQMRSVTLEAEEAWYDRITKSQRDVVFAIYERTGLRPIGNTGLHNIDHFNRTADFGILIGEKACWGKGYGTESTRLMLDYAFSTLGLHNILLQAFDYNQRGMRAYEKAGFRTIGRRREAHRLGGQACDIVLMECLSTEFRGSSAKWPGAEVES
jgi:RimJ/RimL family protein N-acetyltransferase